MAQTVAIETPSRHFSTNLNALRFFGALTIACAHFGYAPLREIHAPLFFFRFLDARSVFTTTFFLLSGYLLTSSLRGRNVSSREFLRRRIARLAPVHWVCFLALLPFLAGSRSGWELLGDAAAWLTMTHGLVPGEALAYNPPAWAVSSFLLGYVLILPISKTRNKRSQLVLALAMLWAAVLLPQVLLVNCVGREFAHVEGHGVGDSAAIVAFAHTFAFFRISEVAFGAVLALLCADCRAPKFLRTDFFVVLAILAVAAPIGLSGSNSAAVYLMTHGLLLPVLGFALVALWYNEGRVRRILAWRPVQSAGRASLLIYFVHYPVLAIWQHAVATVTGIDRAVISASFPLFVLTLAGMVAACCWAQPWYDRLCDHLAYERLAQTHPVPAAPLTIFHR